MQYIDNQFDFWMKNIYIDDRGNIVSNAAYVFCQIGISIQVQGFS